MDEIFIVEFQLDNEWFLPDAFQPYEGAAEYLKDKQFNYPDTTRRIVRYIPETK